MRRTSQIAHQAEVDRFYDLLQLRVDVIRSQYGRIPTPRDLPATRDGWTTRGVYFFFEPGEQRSTNTGPRIVRIGSHSGKSKSSSIESRVVHEHARDWGRSVFRRLVGTALIRKGEFDKAIDRAERDRWAAEWYSRVENWAVHVNPARLQPTLHPLHPIVTRTIENMNLVWVEIDDREQRLELEKQCIMLLSNYRRSQAPVDPPSARWLGHHALKDEVRTSGLWNQQHVKKLHTPGFLDDFQRYFR